jgi:hypothetical protein
MCSRCISHAPKPSRRRALAPTRSTPILVRESSSAISAGRARPACRPERDAGEHDPGDERQRAEQVKEERQFIHVSQA